MEFLINLLIIYGVSAVVTQSKIFEPLRDFTEKKSPEFWHYITSCMQCFPFWAGIFVCLIRGAPVEVTNDILPYWLNLLFAYLFSGALYSGTTMFIHTIQVQIKRGCQKNDEVL